MAAKQKFCPAFHEMSPFFEGMKNQRSTIRGDLEVEDNDRHRFRNTRCSIPPFYDVSDDHCYAFETCQKAEEAARHIWSAPCCCRCLAG
jgi:hypothetical protein